MTEYFKRYRKFISDRLDDENCDLEKLLEYHREHICFFQHERLIHLIVTVLFAICTVVTFIAIAIWQIMLLIPLAVALLVLLIPYIKHYYFLENQTQQLYKDYDRIYRKARNFGLEGEEHSK